MKEKKERYTIREKEIKEAERRYRILVTVVLTINGALIILGMLAIHFHWE